MYKIILLILNITIFTSNILNINWTYNCKNKQNNIRKFICPCIYYNPKLVSNINQFPLKYRIDKINF